MDLYLSLRIMSIHMVSPFSLSSGHPYYWDGAPCRDCYQEEEDRKGIGRRRKRREKTFGKLLRRSVSPWDNKEKEAPERGEKTAEEKVERLGYLV